MQFLQHNLHTVFAHNLRTILYPNLRSLLHQNVTLFRHKNAENKTQNGEIEYSKTNNFQTRNKPFRIKNKPFRTRNKSYSNGNHSWRRNKPLFLKNKPHFQGKVPHTEENVPLMLRKFWRCRNIHRYFHPTSGFGRTHNLPLMENGFALGNIQPVTDAKWVCLGEHTTCQ